MGGGLGRDAIWPVYLLLRDRRWPRWDTWCVIGDLVCLQADEG